MSKGEKIIIYNVIMMVIFLVMEAVDSLCHSIFPTKSTELNTIFINYIWISTNLPFSCMIPVYSLYFLY